MRLASTPMPFGPMIWILVAAVTSAGAAESPQNAPPAAPNIAAPLIAHWAFDEATGDQCADSSGHAWHAGMSPTTTPLVRRRGLFGNALSLSGSHMLRVSEQIPLAHPAGISFSAWAKPVELSSYREIFRKEDGDQRLLFSYQIAPPVFATLSSKRQSSTWTPLFPTYSAAPWLAVFFVNVHR